MCRKIITSTIAKIMRYGSSNMLLQSSIKPQTKQTTPSAIKVLKSTAFANKLVSLSANQIDLEERIFVCLKDQYLVPGKWRQYTQLTSQQQYEAIVNPIEISSSFDQLCAYQQCPSFEGLKFSVWAPNLLNVSYSTSDNLHKTKKIQLKGFKCRVWDHEIRHLQGLLPIYEQICKGKFYLIDEYKNSIEFIKYYQQMKQNQQYYKQSNLKQVQKKFRKQNQQKNKISIKDIAEKLDLTQQKLQNQVPIHEQRSNIKNSKSNKKFSPNKKKPFKPK